MKIIKKVISINLTIILITCFLMAQQKANILMQGNVKDITTGKAVGTTLYFFNSKGKPFHCKSNSIDGAYQQSLPSGDVYDVMIKGYLPGENKMTVDLTQNTKYEEITANIYVKPFEPKMELFKFKFFKPNDSIVINRELIRQIKNFRDFNPEVKMNVIISSYDSWFGNSKRRVEKIDKKGKKYYKTENYTTKERLSDLLEARIVSLRNEFKNHEIYFKPDVFIKDLQVVPQSKKQMKRAVPGKSKKYEYFTPEFENVKIITSK